MILHPVMTFHMFSTTFRSGQVTPAAWCEAQRCPQWCQEYVFPTCSNMCWRCCFDLRSIVVRWCEVLDFKTKAGWMLDPNISRQEWRSYLYFFVGLDILHRLAMKMASLCMQICRYVCVLAVGVVVLSGRHTTPWGCVYLGRDILYRTCSSHSVPHCELQHQRLSHADCALEQLRYGRDFLWQQKSGWASQRFEANILALLDRMLCDTFWETRSVF